MGQHDKALAFDVKINLKAHGIGTRTAYSHYNIGTVN